MGIPNPADREWPNSDQLGQPAADKLFDADAALRRLDGDVELFGTLIAIFQEDSAALLSELSTGFDTNNLPQMERAAHSLKGLACNFNAHRAMQVAASVEEMARTRATDGLSRGVRELGVQLEKLRHALAQWKAG